MSTSSVQRGQFTREPGEFGEVGELSSIAVTRVVRTSLSPGELRASLPLPIKEQAGPVAALTRLFGPGLTVANPLWSGDPLPRLRSLQQVLLSHAMSLTQASRAPALKAISVVEQAVQLRLRWQQMRDSEHEFTPGNRATAVADIDSKIPAEPVQSSVNSRSSPEPRPFQYDDSVAALGLIWGNLNCANYAPAADLAYACLAIWPADQRMRIALALANTEMGRAPDLTTREFLLSQQTTEPAALVLRRSKLAGQF